MLRAKSLNYYDLMRDFGPFEADEMTQRDFAWEEAQVSDFMDDIKALVARRASIADAQHFFGAVVAIQVERPSFNRPKYAVVDGQQRLATFTLFWAAVAARLRGLLGDASADAKAQRVLDDVVGTYLQLVEKKYDDYEEVVTPAFSVTERDRTIFAHLVAGTGEEAADFQPEKRYSTALLDAAFRQLSDELVDELMAGLSPEEQADRLGQLVQWVSKGSHFVLITTTDRVRAHQLFLVLNNRGRVLEDADSLRTHNVMLVEFAAEAERNAVRQNWNVIDAEPRRRVDAFLRHYYSSHQGERLESTGVFDSYRMEFLPPGEEPIEPTQVAEMQKAIALPAALATGMKLFTAIDKGLWPFPEGKASAWERDRLRRLVRVLNSERVKPLLLAAALKGESPLLELLLELERLEFRALVAGVEQNKMANLYIDVAAMLTAGRYDTSLALEDLSAWILAWAPDDKFRSALHDLQYGGGTGYIKHLLATVEDYYGDLVSNPVGNLIASDKMTVIDFDVASDDHVFPQRPPAGTVVPADLDKKRHCLGNQVLLPLGTNQSLSNLLPSDETKISVYRASGSLETKDVGDQLDMLGGKSWSAVEIDARQARLVDWAVKLFDVPRRASVQGLVLPLSRRPAFHRRAAESRKVWLVALAPADGTPIDSVGLDLPVAWKLAKEVYPQDVIVLFTRSPRQIVSVGTVGTIDFTPTGDRRAIYAQFSRPASALAWDDVETRPALTKRVLSEVSEGEPFLADILKAKPDLADGLPSAAAP